MSACLSPLAASPLELLGVRSRGSIPLSRLGKNAGTCNDKRKGGENVGSILGSFLDKCLRMRDLRGNVQVNIRTIIGPNGRGGSLETPTPSPRARDAMGQASGVRNFFQRAPLHVLTDFLSNFFRQKGVTNCNG